MLEEDIGFYFFGEWRYGPLYVFVSIAAQAILTRDPFTIESIGENGGKILLLFDGEKLSGEESVGKYILSATSLLSDDFVEFIAFRDYVQETSNSSNNSDTDEPGIEGELDKNVPTL